MFAQGLIIVKQIHFIIILNKYNIEFCKIYRNMHPVE
jgi:hypothetical protein